MPNNYVSVLYKHIIQVENENVGLKVWWWGGTNIPLPPPPPQKKSKRWGGTYPLAPHPASYASVVSHTNTHRHHTPLPSPPPPTWYEQGVSGVRPTTDLIKPPDRVVGRCTAARTSPALCDSALVSNVTLTSVL